MAAFNKGVDGIEFHTIRGRSAHKHESKAVEVSSFQFIPFVAIAESSIFICHHVCSHSSHMSLFVNSLSKNTEV